MTRDELLLAILAAADGRSFTPVQVQKAAFLATENLKHVVTDGPSFSFEAYDYGPFDSDVYSEAQALQNDGLAVIAPSGLGRWNTYAASDEGVARGKEILGHLDTATRDYLLQLSKWVRSQSFSGLVNFAIFCEEKPMSKPARNIAAMLEKKDIDILEKEHLIPVNLRDARANFSRILMSVKYESNRFVITQHGEPAAVLIPVKDYRIFESLDAIEDGNGDEYTELNDQDIHDRGRSLGEGREPKGQRTDAQLYKTKHKNQGS